MLFVLSCRYESNYFETAEHGGTHLDAPAHFAEGKWRSHQIPIENLIGPGVVIDIKSKVAVNYDHRVSVEDMLEWEKEHGLIPLKAIVLMNSGWSDRYPNKTRVFNSDTPNVPASFHFPGFHEDGVNWLIDNRGIHMIGVDTPSIDHGQSTHFLAHVACGMNNIPAVENVANLDQIPVKGTIVYVAATMILDGSGGPARVFATLDDNDVTDSGYRLELALYLHVLVALMMVFGY
jgi:kynurenine formamidase